MNRSRTTLIAALFLFATVALTGNTPTVAAVATIADPAPQVQLEATTTPLATAGAAVATVRPGDTLSGLAARWCGHANLWPQLYQANRATINNPDLIYPGQRLTMTCATANYTPARTTPAGPAPSPSNSGWVHPLASGVRAAGGGCYGVNRGDHIHQGVDLSAGSGTPIRAVQAGTVALVRYQAGGAGHYVIINHGGGIFSVSMHLRARTPLNVGARVKVGQTVGYVGATGNAHGPHLHFEIHRGGMWDAINPAAFMRARGVSVGC